MEPNSKIMIQGKYDQRMNIERELRKITNNPKFQEIQNRISECNKSLSNALEELENESSPIVETKYMGLIKTLDTKGSFNATFDKIKDLSKTSYNAINACNENMMSILQLMKILATTEKDIYDMIDKNELSVAEISNVIKEICRNANIKDETIEELFNQTFQRSYTLRDRIKQLRIVLEERINKLEQKFINLDQTIEYEKNEITTYCKKVKSSVQEESNHILTKYEKELNNIIQTKQTQLNEIESKCTNIFNNIKTAESNFNTKLNNLENQIREELLHFVNEKIEEQNKQIKLCQENIESLKKKNFLDTYIYKIIVGLASISALVLSLF